MTDALHQALKTEIVDTKSSGAAEVMLVRFQHGKDSFTYSLHVRPTTFSLSGWQTPDLLGQLGFAHGNCNFVLGGQCYSRGVGANFDTLRQHLPPGIAILRHLRVEGVCRRHVDTARTAQRSRPYDERTGRMQGCRRNSPILSTESVTAIARICKTSSLDGLKRLNRRRRRTADPDFPRPAAIDVHCLKLEGLAIARSWGFESPLPHHPSLTLANESVSYGWQATAKVVRHSAKREGGPPPRASGASRGAPTQIDWRPCHSSTFCVAPTTPSTSVTPRISPLVRH